MEHFKIQADPKNCRIREYARERRLLMLKAFGPELDNATLETAKISAFRDYTLEVKTEKEKFAEFTDDDIYLQVLVYSPSFTCLDEDKLPVKNLHIKRTWKVREVFSKIATELGVEMSPEKMRIFKRAKSEMYQESSFEQIFYEENLDKQLKDLGVYEGGRLYVETIVSEEDRKRSRWIRALNEDRLKIYVQFNNPYKTMPDDFSVEYEHQLDVSKAMTLAELKAKIGETLKLAPAEFVLRRGGKHCPEMKETTQTLGALGFLRNSSVYVEFGKPSASAEYKVVIAEATISKNETDDVECHEFAELGEVPIKADATVAQVKDLICKKLEKERKLALPAGRIRLRERLSDKLGKVMLDGCGMKSYGLFDGKQLAFQILEETESLGPDDIMVVAREWDPSTWALGERREFVIKTSWRMHDLSYQICEAFPEYRSKIGQLMVGKVVSLWNFKRGDLLGMQVYSLGRR